MLFARIPRLVSIFVLVDLKISRFVRETQLPADWLFFAVFKTERSGMGSWFEKKGFVLD